MVQNQSKVNSTVPSELAPEKLRNRCDPKLLTFENTDELQKLKEVVGQPRAFRALELGSELVGKGFNVFVLGLPGSGRMTLSQEYLERKAKQHPIPSDWCYVHNFSNPHNPKELQLFPGKGIEFKADMLELLEICYSEIQQVFKSEEYQLEQEKITSAMQKNREKELTRLESLAIKYSFILVKSPVGFMLLPAVKGKPLRPEEVAQLAPDKRKIFEKLKIKLEGEANQTLEKIKKLEKEAYQKIQQLDSQTTLYVLEPLIASLMNKYQDSELVVEHLGFVQDDIIQNLDIFKRDDKNDSPSTELVKRYDVNVFINNGDLENAPVIVENHPSYPNLLGKIEHELVLGASRTDYTMIRAGALHRANGGYLILPARDLLLNPYAWEGVKRTLREESIRIIGLEAQYGLAGAATLEPEPIPLRTKIILIGTPLLYYLLRAYDEDFAKLFKIRSEFAVSMDRTQETENEYALFIKSVIDNNQLLPFDKTAVARIIEQGSRFAEDQNKLSTRLGRVADLIQEASYWAKNYDREIVTALDVENAVAEMIYRNNLLEERMQEVISDGIILIDVEGKSVGKVNALSVVSLGEYAFGHPTRVTASVSPGSSGVVDIERQAKLGGPIHTKGILIVGGLLRQRFGRDKPLGLSASITFEQSYGGVEGDSASAAELVALLSAIGEVPIDQNIAITGSVNQHGDIQSVGGINEKIEGFFYVCESAGFTGRQGVIVPSSNTHNLMLAEEVIEAVSEGNFHIWPVFHIDEALFLLTGLYIGELQEDGTYPENTFNALVNKQLVDFNTALEKKLPRKNFDKVEEGQSEK